MAVSIEDVRAYVNAPSSDVQFIGSVLTEAQALVARYCGKTPVPVSVFDNAVTQTAAELYHRRNAPSGIASFAAIDGSVVRVALDPMKSVYAILDRYVSRGV